MPDRKTIGLHTRDDSEVSPRGVFWCLAVADLFYLEKNLIVVRTLALYYLFLLPGAKVVSL